MTVADFMRWIAYLLSFGLGRGALFCAPLVLANVMPAVAYGHLETALAAASVLTGLATLGTASGVPLVLLGRNLNASMSGIVTHHLLVVAVCVGFLLIGVAFQWPPYTLMSAVLTAGLAMQGLASVHLKTLGRGDGSVLIDAGLLGIMALTAAVAQLAHPNTLEHWVWLAAGAYAVAFVGAYIWYLARPARAMKRLAWRATLSMGVPLMLGGLVSLLATTSGRLGMGLMAMPELTAEYSVLARAAALPIVAHQLILVAKFRNLFSQPDDVVEQVTLRIVLLVAFSVLVFMGLSRWLGIVLGPAFSHAFKLHHGAGFWIVAQSVLWSAIALNDLVIARHQVMSRILPYSGGFLCIFLILGWLTLHTWGLSLEHFVIVHSSLMLLFYGAQSWAMHRLGLHLCRTWLAAVLCYFSAILISGFVY